MREWSKEKKTLLSRKILDHVEIDKKFFWRPYCSQIISKMTKHSNVFDFKLNIQLYRLNLSF